MQHLDEGTIHGWLDGELPIGEREKLEAHIASCEQCAAAVADARGFVAASSRILTALDSVPSGVLPAASTGASASGPAVRRRFVPSRVWMAVAAVLILSTVTVVATRPSGDTEQLRVAAATRDQKELPASMAPSEERTPARKSSVGPQAADSHANGAVASVAPNSLAAPANSAQAAGAAVSRSAPAPMQSRAPAPSDAPKPVDQTERLKSRLQAERQSTRVRPSNGAPSAMADAAPPPRVADAKTLSNRVTEQTASRPADSAAKAPLALSEVVVTGEGASSAPQKLASPTGTDSSPAVVSRSTRMEGEDTVVTTVYAVQDGTVTLIEHSSARDRLDQHPQMAKSRQDSQINSITWSDSSGRTRTLRGAVSREQLERIRAALFGATP